MIKSNLLSCEEVARLLAISTSSVYTLIASGRLTSIRIGRAIRVSPDDLESFIRQRRSSKLEPVRPSTQAIHSLRHLGRRKTN